MNIDEKHKLLSNFKKELNIDKIFCFIYFLISFISGLLIFTADMNIVNVCFPTFLISSFLCLLYFISVVENRIKNIIILVSIED